MVLRRISWNQIKKKFTFLTFETRDIHLQSWMKLALLIFPVIFGRFSQNAHYSKQFVCSAHGHPILALFVLIDRTACQFTRESVMASSGTHFFVFLIFFLNALIFQEWDSKTAEFGIKTAK